MRFPDNAWREVAPTLHTCVFPPRTPLEANGGDCLGVFVQKEPEGWKAWQSDGSWTEIHPTLADAKRVVDARVAVAWKAASDTITRAYGLDGAKWAYDPKALGKGASFLSREDDGLAIENQGRRYALMRDGKPVDHLLTARAAAERATNLVVDAVNEAAEASEPAPTYGM